MGLSTAWTKKCRIKIDHTKVGGTDNLVNFPVLLKDANFVDGVYTECPPIEIYSSWLLDGAVKAYFRFNTGALTTDSSGNSHTLTDISDPAEVAGVFGTAADFDGNDAYSATDHADFKPTGKFTILFRIKTTTGSTSGIFQSMSINSNYAGYRIGVLSSGKIYWHSGKNSGTTANTDYKELNGNTAINDGSYHAVACSWDGSYMYIYIDGFLDSYIAWANAPVYAATNYVRVACFNSSGANGTYLTGAIDELTVIHRSLSAEEIRAVSQGGHQIRFSTDIDGLNVLSHEVVKWDAANKVSEVWVNVPSVAYATDTDFYVWYDNDTVTPYGREFGCLDTLRSDANLKAYYKTATGALTTDSSGNGKTLTNNNSVADGTGMFGGAADFGSSNSSKYLGISDNLVGTGSFSYSLWIQNTADIPNSGDGIGYVSKATSSDKVFYYINYVNRSGVKTLIFARGKNGVASQESTYVIDLGVNVKHNFVFTWDGSYMRGYLDGALVAGPTAASGNGTTALGDYFQIGVENYWMKGLIWDIAVLDRVLTPLEVAAINGRGVAAWNSSYVAVYHLQSLASAIARDSTINGYQLDKTGTPTNGAAKIGNGVDLDGSTGQYLSIADASCPSLEIAGSKTYIAWIKPSSSYADGAGIAFKSNSALNKYMGIEAASYTSNPYAKYYNSATANDSLLGATAITKNVWSYIGGTTDATAGKIRVYLNGAQDAAEINRVGASADTDGIFAVGRYGGYTSSGYFKGSIDQVAVLNVATTDGWHLTVYNNQNAPDSFAVAMPSSVKSVENVAQLSVKKIAGVANTSAKKILGVTNY